jgi:hypothetical protein
LKEKFMEEHGKRSSPVAILLAWAVVVVPLAWGFSYTLTNALKIFTAPGGH